MGGNMRSKCSRNVITVFIFLGCVLTLPTITLSKETKQEWEVLNPEGVVKIEPMKVNPHPSTLEGKTVMLRWNGKHNGDKFLERVGELLKERVKDVKVIKSWEVAPETVDPITGNQERSQEFAKAIAKFKPDLVIGAQSD
jgi:hypothetical protein